MFLKFAYCQRSSGQEEVSQVSNTILEEGEKGNLTADKATTAAKTVLRFIGNALVQMAREQRKRAIVDMNDKVIELSEKDSIYEDATPTLFGDQFAKKQKLGKSSSDVWIEA